MNQTLIDTAIEVEALHPSSVCRVSKIGFQMLVSKFKIDQLFRVTSEKIIGDSYETIPGFEIEFASYLFFYHGIHIFCMVEQILPPKLSTTDITPRIFEANYDSLQEYEEDEKQKTKK